MSQSSQCLTLIVSTYVKPSVQNPLSDTCVLHQGLYTDTQLLNDTLKCFNWKLASVNNLISELFSTLHELY